MRSVRLHGPGDVRLDQVPEPEKAPNRAVVALEACGVCGSDVHFVDGTARTAHVPITLGHEIAGRVVTDPSGTFQPETPVVVAVGWFCSSCPRCLEGRPNLCQRAQIPGIHHEGGLAERVAVRPESLIARPEEIPPATAATTVDAGATAFHAVTRRAKLQDGESVLILGVGGLGSYAIQVARLAGAGAVLAADVDAAALDHARDLGADETILVEAGASTGRTAKLLTDGGVDAAIEFVGSARAVQDAVKAIRPGGRAVVVGVGPEPVRTLPPVLWSNNEYVLMGSYGSLPGDTETMLGLLAAGEVQPPATVTVALDDAPELLLSMAAGTAPSHGRPVAVP